MQSAVVPQVCKHTLEEIAGKRQGHYIAFKAPEALFSNIFKLLSDPTAPSANAFKGMMQDKDAHKIPYSICTADNKTLKTYTKALKSGTSMGPSAQLWLEFGL